ncbi:metallophosphoesterase, partial [bacterium]|nr:metallophosphoesterase [bacterium]
MKNSRYALLAALAVCPANAQVAYTGGVYNQNFDSLPGTTNNTLNTAWSDNSTLPGWYANKATFSVTDATIGGTAAAFLPTAAANPNNVGLFSLGSAASADRALGSRATAAVAGNDPVLYGVRLVNNTAQTLTSFTVTYTGEQWFKSGKTTADSLLVDYQLGATSIAAGTWTAATGGTFTSLVNTATAATLAGNTAANRRGIAVKVTGVSWAPGTELWVRFRDADNTGDEQALAVDDFNFVADNESGVFFNGATSYVTMGQGATAAALNTSSFTVECRFMRTGPGVTASTGTGGITTALPLVAKGVGEGDGANLDANYFLGIDNTTGKLVADFEQFNATNNGTAYPPGQNFPVFGSTVLQNGVFYHVAATYDTATAIWKLYVNGVAETTTQTLPTFVGVVPRPDNIQGLGIGTTINSTGARSGFFHGIIDEARIWNVVRTPAEILANKDVKITSGVSGLLGRYGFDEGTGTSAAGINAAGTASPVGTLAGNPLPAWVNTKSFVANVLPTVALTAPADNSSQLSGSTVNLTATAADSDGTIAKVEFYNGATKLGEDTSAPYSFDWSNLAVGDFTLTAKAIDSSSGSATSSSAVLHVTANAVPSVALTAPADDSSVIAPASVDFTATASDSDGSVAKVEFYNGTTKLGEDSTEPYTFNWSGVAQGNYSLSARAIDDLNGTGTSTVAVLHVMAPATTPPTVAITAPADGASVVFPANFTITADAADSDGTVAKVEFFEGSVKLGEDTSAPYSLAWNNAAVGDHVLTAVATDDMTATTTSAAVTVQVLANQAPVATVNAPATNATGIGSSVALDLSLADPESAAQTVTYYGRKTTPATPGADFTIATLPDTQFYSENLANNGRSATYYAQTQWLVDNRETLNLAFVSHMGDIVQNGDAVPAEWAVADAAMKKIENQSNTLRAYGIPWGGAPGNHDQTSIGNAGGANSYYNQYFGASRFAGRNYWGGSQSPTNNNNNYQLFRAGGMDFIIIHMEYDVRSKTSYQAVLDWADALLKANPDRRAIVTSHWIVNTGNPATFSTQGQDIYNDLKDNSNLFLLLCGHVAGEGQRTDTYQGRAVHSVLQDYQGRTNGGDGWLRFFVFSPANNTISAKTYRVSNPVNPAAGTYETDADSQFTLPYNMQGAITAWIPLGTVNVAAGDSTSSLNWTGLETGSDYEWYASANDGQNTVTTATQRFTSVPAAAPAVAITSPASGASFGNNTAVEITADASDADGTISKVEFYANAVKLGEDTTAPYSYSWPNVAANNYALTAVALDNSNQATLSSAVNLTVTNTPPEVTLTQPAASGSSSEIPANILLAATASDSDGTVAKVEFYAGATKVGEDSTDPYEFNWTSGITGSYTISAKAIDNAGAVTTSNTVDLALTNTSNDAPTAAVTSPTSGAAFVSGTTVTINATASDSDGVVANVEFYRGTTKLGEDSTAPYSFAWTGVAVGNYSLTVVATDNDGRTVTSASVPISVASAGARSLVTSVAENFDSMGTGTTFLLGWSIKNANAGGNTTWTDSLPITGTGTGGLASMIATTGTLTYNNVANGPAANNVNGYNLRGANDSDRVLGTAPTSVTGVAIQLQLTNGSGNPISALQIGYDIRRYVAVATANELPGYWLFYSLDNGATWSNVSTLNPTLGGAGVQVPNTLGVTTVPVTTVTLASAWAANADLLLRWVDDNAVVTSPDHIVGLDNVSIAAVSTIGTAPSVALTAPLASDSFLAPTTVSLAAAASDADGSINKVEFYNGATKLGEDLTAPYTCDWTNVAAGSYDITARATDNDSNIAVSTAVTITVSAPPSSGTLLRGPYLNMANQNSIVVRWRGSQSIIGRVRYGLAP